VSGAVGVQAIWRLVVVDHQHLKLCGAHGCGADRFGRRHRRTHRHPGEASVQPDQQAGPRVQGAAGMPDWWIRQPAMLEAAMDDILGVHDISAVAPSGVESGVALVLSSDDTVGRWPRRSASAGGGWRRWCSSCTRPTCATPGSR
jgi:hypothetical protein